MSRDGQAANARQSARRHNARYEQVLARAEAHAAAGRLDAAAALAQIAACYAFPSHVGLFGSPRLERLLLALGRAIDAGAPPAAAAAPPDARRCVVPPDARRCVVPPDARRCVVHVLSYAKPIGGDSRYAWRWIEHDRGSRHVAVVTRQDDVAGTYAVPPQLEAAVRASGGHVHCLAPARGSLVSAARELREHCRHADVVVLHLYPYDIVPSLALARGCEQAKVLYVHHSDHTFWVGSGVSHLVAHLRTQSPGFLARRRGLRAGREVMLPIPLDGAAPDATDDAGTSVRPDAALREAARREFGCAPGDCLLVSIASPFKYSAAGQTGFRDLVLPLVEHDPRMRLVLVGPADEGPWAEARERTGGRVRALGRRWGNESLLAAADVYLDSVPFSSITSLLEAGLVGLPLLGCVGPDPDMGLMGPGAPGLDGTMLVADSPESYRALLRRLVDDRAFREGAGRAVRRQIVARHGEAAWRDSLEAVYAALDATDPRHCLDDGDDHFDFGTLDQALVQLFRQVQGPRRTRQLIAQHAGALPYATRVAVTLQLARSGLALCFLNLLPASVGRTVRRLGRGVAARLSTAAPSYGK